MSRNKKKDKRDPAVSFLDFIIVITVFAMIPVGFRMWFYLGRMQTHSFTQEASRMSFDLTRNDYASLIQGKYINEFNGINDTKSYHALADYTEAVSMYKIYVEKGYDDRAGEEKKAMDKARKDMGELTVFADKVDVMFDMEGASGE